MGIKEADAVAIDAHIAALAASADDTDSMLGEALQELAAYDADCARIVHEVVFDAEDGASHLFHDPRYRSAQIINACMRAVEKARPTSDRP